MSKDDERRLREKLAQKREEERKISPEEQRFLDAQKKRDEERARKRELELAEERRESEFNARCDQELRPIFEAIQELVFHGQKSKIVVKHSNSYPCDPEHMQDARYRISLQWGFEYQADPHGPGGGEFYRSISMNVILDAPDPEKEGSGKRSFIKNELVITDLSKMQKVRAGFFGGEKHEWETKVSLNDADWKEKVED